MASPKAIVSMSKTEESAGREEQENFSRGIIDNMQSFLKNPCLKTFSDAYPYRQTGMHYFNPSCPCSPYQCESCPLFEANDSIDADCLFAYRDDATDQHIAMAVPRLIEALTIMGEL